MELDKFATSLSKASPVAPDSDSARGIGEVNNNVAEYKNATAATPTSAATPTGTPGERTMTAPSPADRVNPSAHYGDRGGEKRIDVGPMLKDLPSHHIGTPYVDHTGPAMLEKGEAVIPKEKNPMHHMMEHLKSELGTPADKVPAKKLKHIVTRKAGEGHVHEHHYTHPDHHAPTEHATHGTDGMINHMMEHMSEPNPGEQEANDGQSGIPAGTPGMDGGQ